nr:MAG TPA: hypothetical protein [Caudoviricetes sp.]
MYARKSGFCHKKVKKGSHRTCETSQKRPKGRKITKKPQKHALYALYLRTKHLTRINTKKPLQ